jgi:hypothetical protein
VDPRTGLDNVNKRKFLTLPGLELKPLGRPTRIQSLHRRAYAIDRASLHDITIAKLCVGYLRKQSSHTCSSGGKIVPSTKFPVRPAHG